jgi:hypothetical protein
MTQPVSQTALTKKFQLSIDAWAVIVASVAALLIRTGIISRVPW